MVRASPGVAEVNAAYTDGIDLQRRAEQESMLRLMRDVAAAGNSPHAGGLPGDMCVRVRAHQHSAAHHHSLTSQVHAQHRHIQMLEEHVRRLTSHTQATERRAEQLFALLEAAQDRPPGLPMPLPPAVAMPLARYSSACNPPTSLQPAVPLARSSSAGNPPTPLAPAEALARSSSAGNPPTPLAPAEALISLARSSLVGNPPTPLTPAEAVPLSRFASAGNVFAAAISASPRRLKPGAGVIVPAHSTTSSPTLMPSAGNPPSSAEGAEVAWSAQPSGAFAPYVRPMQVAPTAAQMQPFHPGEAPWSPVVQIPGGRRIPYLMPQQQQPMAMQMQQMAHMWSQPGPMQVSPLMPSGQTHFSQPLMGQPPHMHMSQQQCKVPMPRMMYCSPQMPGQPLPPAGGSLGVSPAAGPSNPHKRRLG